MLFRSLPLSKLDCSDPHTEPNGMIHTDAPQSKLNAVDAAKHLKYPSSDPLHALNETSSDPLHALDETSSDPLHAQNNPSTDLVDTPICTNAFNTHDPSSDLVDAHGEFSFSVSHSDPLIFLRSTLISPIHPLITSVLTPTHTTSTHCDASSLLLFLLLLYIIFLGLLL